jgi:hypothetical protein
MNARADGNRRHGYEGEFGHQFMVKVGTTG